MENLVYTIPKINPMFVENDGSAVNNMIIFNLQITRRWKIHAILKIMSKSLLIKDNAYVALKWMRIKDNNLLFNIEIDSEFLMLISRWNQSFRVNRKKEYMEQSVTVVRCYIVITCADSSFLHWKWIN